MGWIMTPPTGIKNTGRGAGLQRNGERAVLNLRTWEVYKIFSAWTRAWEKEDRELLTVTYGKILLQGNQVTLTGTTKYMCVCVCVCVCVCIDSTQKFTKQDLSHTLNMVHPVTFLLCSIKCESDQIRSDQSLSHVRLFATPWIAARQASLSITNSWSSLRLMSIESAMPSSNPQSWFHDSSLENNRLEKLI